MFESEAATREIEARNLLRSEAGLPTLPVREELQRMEKAHRQREVDNFVYGSPVRFLVQERLLRKTRERLGNPEWKPSGYLSGGGAAFDHAIAKRMLRLWRLKSRSSE